MPKKEEKPQRSRVEDIVPTHVKLKKSDFIRSREELDIFSFHRLFTGLIDIDLVLRPSLGKRIGIIGDRSVGKTLLCHIMEGAAMRTCRQCLTPIIPWVNEETGEIKECCKCRKNDPMVVIHLDMEDSFDPKWAKRWGVEVDPEEGKHKGYRYHKDKNEKFWAVLPVDGNTAFDFIYDAISKGAADFVVIDSLAVLTPRETLERKKPKKEEDGDKGSAVVGIGQERISPRARLLAMALPKIIVAQSSSKMTYGGKSTLVWTNQYYMGPVRNPKQDPRRASGGLKAGYQVDQEIRMSARVPPGAGEGIEKAAKFIEVSFTSIKSKVAGTPGGAGRYKLFLDRIKTKHGELHAGDSDEPDRLKAYLEQLGLFEETQDCYKCLGREFKKVSDLRSFLSRRDIQFLARYPIFMQLMPETARDHLEEAQYDYSPFGRDPIFDLVTPPEKPSSVHPEEEEKPGDDEEGTEDLDRVVASAAKKVRGRKKQPRARKR